jgi:gamma-glutamyl-gamma-aminobutyrate hydrolase PuuD
VAWAEDGTVEGLEGAGEQLYLGVQWHVESLVDRPEHLALFRRLVEEAGAYGEGRERRAA